MSITELQNAVASSDPAVAAAAEAALRNYCRETFPALSGDLDDRELVVCYETALWCRDDSPERYWLRTWYLQQLLNDRQCDWATPTAKSTVGRLLTFLADEVSRWTARRSRHSVEILNSLTEIVEQLRRQENEGTPLDLRRIEYLAVTICIGLELLTGDESALLRFGRALKAVKTATAEDIV